MEMELATGFTFYISYVWSIIMVLFLLYSNFSTRHLKIHIIQFLGRERLNAYMDTGAPPFEGENYKTRHARSLN